MSDSFSPCTALFARRVSPKTLKLRNSSDLGAARRGSHRARRSPGHGPEPGRARFEVWTCGGACRLLTARGTHPRLQGAGPLRGLAQPVLLDSDETSYLFWETLKTKDTCTHRTVRDPTSSLHTVTKFTPASTHAHRQLPTQTCADIMARH